MRERTPQYKEPLPFFFRKEALVPKTHPDGNKVTYIVALCRSWVGVTYWQDWMVSDLLGDSNNTMVIHPDPDIVEGYWVFDQSEDEEVNYRAAMRMMKDLWAKVDTRPLDPAKDAAVHSALVNATYVPN